MRLTLLIAAVIAAISTFTMSGCGGADPAAELSNVDGMRSMVYLSPQAEYPRICFASRVNGEYQTNVSNKLPFARTSTDAVDGWCSWPTAAEGTWWIIVYNDKNKDSIYQVNELLGIADIVIRKDAVRGKFEVLTFNDMICTNWDAQAKKGPLIWISSTFLP